MSAKTKLSLRRFSSARVRHEVDSKKENGFFYDKSQCKSNRRIKFGAAHADCTAFAFPLYCICIRFDSRLIDVRQLTYALSNSSASVCETNSAPRTRHVGGIVQCTSECSTRAHCANVQNIGAESQCARAVLFRRTLGLRNRLGSVS